VPYPSVKLRVQSKTRLLAPMLPKHGHTPNVMGRVSEQPFHVLALPRAFG
jgi:hypothetical protein